MQPAGPTFKGSSNKSLFVAIILAFLLLGSLAFGLWAYQGRQNYKNNADQLVASAVTTAKAQQASDDQAKYNAQLGKPYKTFQGPDTYGSVKFNYPKVWSAYNNTSSTDEPINAYFYPNVVPADDGNGATAYSLRVELMANTYDSVVQNYQSLVQDGSASASVYVPAKMIGNHNVERGTKFIGSLPNVNGKGIAIVIPVRNQTLAIYTESLNNKADFENVVLPSLTFNP